MSMQSYRYWGDAMTDNKPLEVTVTNLHEELRILKARLDLTLQIMVPLQIAVLGGLIILAVHIG